MLRQHTLRILRAFLFALLICPTQTSYQSGRPAIEESLFYVKLQNFVSFAGR